MKIVAIVNRKGGVGKTTTAINLANTLAYEGKKTLVIDLDSQCNSSSTFGFIAKRGDYTKTAADVLLGRAKAEEVICKSRIENLYLLPGDKKLEKREKDYDDEVFVHKEMTLLNAVKDLDYAYIIIDCWNNLRIFTINAMYAADVIVVPVEFNLYAADGLDDVLPVANSIINSSNAKPRKLRILINKYMPAATITAEAGMGDLSGYKDMILKTRINNLQSINQSPWAGGGVILLDKNSSASKKYVELTKEISAL